MLANGQLGCGHLTSGDRAGVDIGGQVIKTCVDLCGTQFYLLLCDCEHRCVELWNKLFIYHLQFVVELTY